MLLWPAGRAARVNNPTGLTLGYSLKIVAPRSGPPSPFVRQGARLGIRYLRHQALGAWLGCHPGQTALLPAGHAAFRRRTWAEPIRSSWRRRLSRTLQREKRREEEEEP